MSATIYLRSGDERVIPGVRTARPETVLTTSGLRRRLVCRDARGAVLTTVDAETVVAFRVCPEEPAQTASGTGHARARSSCRGARVASMSKGPRPAPGQAALSG